MTVLSSETRSVLTSQTVSYHTLRSSRINGIHCIIAGKKLAMMTASLVAAIKSSPQACRFRTRKARWCKVKMIRASLVPKDIFAIVVKGCANYSSNTNSPSLRKDSFRALKHTNCDSCHLKYSYISYNSYQKSHSQVSPKVLFKGYRSL